MRSDSYLQYEPDELKKRKRLGYPIPFTPVIDFLFGYVRVFEFPCDNQVFKSGWSEYAFPRSILELIVENEHFGIAHLLFFGAREPKPAHQKKVRMCLGPLNIFATFWFSVKLALKIYICLRYDVRFLISSISLHVAVAARNCM